MSNVLTINGTVAPAARIPDPDVMSVAERLAELAASGEIQSVAVAYGYADGAAGRQIGGKVHGYAILGAATMLVTDLKGPFR